MRTAGRRGCIKTSEPAKKAAAYFRLSTVFILSVVTSACR